MARKHIDQNAHDTFIHFDNCLDRLRGAHITLQLVSQHPGHALVASAFRYALVEYAVAFKTSRGQDGARYALGNEVVPPEFLALHDRVISARDQLHAHGDLAPLDARAYVRELNGELLAGVVQNQIDWVAELPNLTELLRLIEGVIDRMLPARPGLKAALPRVTN